MSLVSLKFHRENCLQLSIQHLGDKNVQAKKNTIRQKWDKISLDVKWKQRWNIWIQFMVRYQLYVVEFLPSIDEKYELRDIRLKLSPLHSISDLEWK